MHPVRCKRAERKERRLRPGCAAVLCGHILPRLRRGSQKRVLFTATGALMSQTTFLQKETIPAVAHLVELRAPEKEK